MIRYSHPRYRWVNDFPQSKFRRLSTRIALEEAIKEAREIRKFGVETAYVAQSMSGNDDDGWAVMTCDR